MSEAELRPPSSAGLEGTSSDIDLCPLRCPDGGDGGPNAASHQLRDCISPDHYCPDSRIISMRNRKAFMRSTVDDGLDSDQCHIWHRRRNTWYPRDVWSLASVCSRSSLFQFFRGVDFYLGQSGLTW